ncbi:tryptophan 7-halogenase [Frateuria sp. MAH-13]|uniref:Tryptophan 7-halogenase n=1 Tax=Frateuria flava TaxID=2821489 RepID=A0ABS4DP15_9GAMM|nr:tryptophan 7-halogenase [Frateuria flava]MBP1474788.1 tryptophan 7-halogenase [Frateuria flava]
MADDHTTHDAVILGGGLAGLCLALQLRGEFPDMDIVVLERQRHPLPLAAHKVGESTVEIAAHYFEQVLGLHAHLQQAQLRKFGLRMFFSEGQDRLDQCTELGVSHVLPTPSYQIDRGLFENFLGEEARRRGIDFRDGARVRGFELGHGGERHGVRYSDQAGEHALACRWLLDASGRAGLLRHRLDLTRDNGHHVNAAWFRLDERLVLDDWCRDNAAWHERCEPPERWRSTNHLCGEGYWVWMIPLSSGAHSIGIVADEAIHPLESFQDFARARAWLARHQPALSRAIERCADSLMDFRFLRGCSYGCAQVFSADRWALTGEAGLFLDPFYSPGGDFIAIANTYICMLVAQDRADKPLAPYARLYQRLYFSFYESTLALYRGQYPLFGDPAVMPAKVAWDYSYYWGVLCQLFFQKRLGDATLFAELAPQLTAAQQLNEQMQAFFGRWHACSSRGNPPGLLDQCRAPWLVEINRGLRDRLDDAGIRSRLNANLALLREVAGAIAAMAARDGMAVDDLPACTGPAPALFDVAPVRAAAPVV